MLENPLGLSFLKAFLLTNVSDSSPLFWSWFSSLSLPHQQDGAGNSNTAIPGASTSVASSVKWVYSANGQLLYKHQLLRRVRVSLHARKDLLKPLWSCTISTYRLLLKIN